MTEQDALSHPNNPERDAGPLNADAGELARFSEIAMRWWDLDGEAKPLHQLNPTRLDWIRQRVVLRGARVLDIGCGGGLLCEPLCRAGAVVTGLDATEAGIAVARLHALSAGLDIDYQQATVEQWAQANPDRQFDCICCLELLEHVPDPGAIIDCAATLLAPGGELFVSTINRTAKAWALAIVGAEHLLRLVPRGTHSFDKFIKPSELDDAARAAGLRLTDMTGFRYHPFGEDFSTCDDVSVNYMVQFSAPSHDTSQAAGERPHA